MKMPKIYRAEFEIACANRAVFILVAIWAHIKIGVKKGVVNVIGYDKDRHKWKVGKQVIYVIPKLYYKKARPEDADL